ncbi:hypothetical protein ACMZOO_17930 (plasmid) [Catenovulum sp. SX2]|uniref:hypothetical protein n=1 Tax=Catenovulum sp. SX2 TaxID=3398614 RepID=UPI003F83516E
MSFVAKAQMNIPDLPAPGSSNFANSDVYTAQVKQGAGSWQTLHIKRNDSQDELITSNTGGVYKNRSFHFTPFSFDTNAGALTIRVTKNQNTISENVSSGAANVEVVNADSTPIKIDNNTIEFTLNQPKYVLVNFAVASNKNTYNGTEVIKRPLAIFADELNSDNDEPFANAGETKVVYDSSTTYQDMYNADIIVFRGGFHDVKNHQAQGAIPANNGKTIWLHPRALVTGYIERATGGGLGDDTLVYGRGVLYGGDFRNPVNTPNTGPYWKPDQNNNSGTGMFEAAILGDRATLRGLIIADIMWHGVVMRSDSVIENVKIWGWHGNNDAFRPGNGTLVKNNFIRAVDDALYTRAIVAEGNLFYQSYNGAIVTCGWENVADSGDIVLNNNVIYRPEWSGLGNNNGVLASQMGPYSECKNIEFNNTEIYGPIIGITNLKESSRLSNSVYDPTKHQGTPGIRNVTFNNTTVYGDFTGKSVIDPTTNIVIEDVVFNNFKVLEHSASYLANADRSTFFQGAGATDNSVLKITTGSNAAVAQGTYFLDHAASLNRLRYQSSSDTCILGTGTGTWFQWQVVHTDGEWFQIVHVATGKVLGSENDLDINLYTATSSGSEYQWKFIDEGEYGRIIHRDSGLRIHFNENGTMFQLGPNTWTGDRTKWKFTSVN